MSQILARCIVLSFLFSVIIIFSQKFSVNCFEDSHNNQTINDTILDANELINKSRDLMQYSIVLRISFSNLEERIYSAFFYDGNQTYYEFEPNIDIRKVFDDLESGNYKNNEINIEKNDTITTVSIFGPASNYTRSLIGDLFKHKQVASEMSDTNNNKATKMVEQIDVEEAKLQRLKSLYDIESLFPPLRSVVEIIAENYTISKISEEANSFALKLFHQINAEKTNQNILSVSPISIYDGLALLLYGAEGETAKEMDKVLLGSQSSYNNYKLTHDQDRKRLMNSMGDVMRKLKLISLSSSLTPTNNASEMRESNHLIIANNLLFSPQAYEISNELKQVANNYYRNTAFTKVEPLSYESIFAINSWIQKQTFGMIPTIYGKKDSFDEYNVLTMLCTSWLSYEWKDLFYRVRTPLKSRIRFKSPRKSPVSNLFSIDPNATPLMEFVDDEKKSHFVEYILSEPSSNIKHFRLDHLAYSSFKADLLDIPFKDDQFHILVLMPRRNETQLNFQAENSTNSSDSEDLTAPPIVQDVDYISELIRVLSSRDKRALRDIWNLVSPPIITKQITQNQNIARLQSVSFDDDEGDELDDFNNNKRGYKSLERHRNQRNSFVRMSIPSKIQVAIPTFKTDIDMSLAAALNRIGLVNAFDSNQANFIGINGHPFNEHSLHISDVIYKSTFNLNEKGVNYDRTIQSLEELRVFKSSNKNKIYQDKNIDYEHSTMSLNRPEDELNFVAKIALNKPFLYLICDTKTRLIVFSGLVRSPTEN